MIIFFTCLLFAVPGARADSGGPHLTFNVTTGQVYSHRDAFDRWYPASLTKMMTAYTVFREIEKGRITLNSPVRVTERAMSEPPTKMGFPLGTVLTVEKALQIILVKSANDVSTALAESVGGSVVNFANLMNRYGREIGMTNSHFVNPHGLPDDRQYSTAHDLGMLARALYRQFPQHQDMFAIGAVRVGGRTFRNHNALIRNFPGTIGLKTGFICSGGVSLAASIRHEDEIIVSIVLGEIRGRIRNLRTAEFLASARDRKLLKFVDIDELKPAQPPRAARDISDYVCGRKPLDFVPLMYNDPAVELFAIKLPVSERDIEARESVVYGEVTEEAPTVTITLNGADGPDPYRLLVEKEPFPLADEDFMSENRIELEDGKIVAIPIRRPPST